MRPSAIFRLLAPALIGTALLTCATSALALSPGDPDPTFGTDGVAYYALGAGPTPAAQINAIAIQPDEKIVLAGSSTDAGGRDEMFVARLDRGGSLDQGFGDGGTVIKQLGTGDLANSSAHALALQPDGKIIVGLQAQTDPFSGLLAARLNPNGSFDSDFADGGKVFIDTPADDLWNVSIINAVAVQPDGRIVLAGTRSLYHADQLLVARVNGVNGSLDSSFADGGVLQQQLQPDGLRLYTHARGVALQPDGRILISGDVGNDTFAGLIALRLKGSDGGFDSTFGEGGEVLYEPFGTNCGSTGEGDAVEPQLDGRIVVAGAVGGIPDCGGSPTTRAPASLTRLMGANGAFDPTFGDGGTFLTDGLGGTPSPSHLYGLALRPDGKIVAGGFANDGVGKNEFLIARFNAANGGFDGSFGVGGKVLKQLASSGASEVRALALQPDGKIVAAGFAGSQVAVMRLIGDTPPSDGSNSGGGGGGGSQLGPQNQVATISKLGITPAVFAAAPSGPSIAKTIGAQVSYENTQAATTMLTILKPVRGIRYKGGCVKPSHRRHGKRCTRWVAVGRFPHTDQVGLNSFHFTGRVYGRKLRPGRYRLRARPRFAGPAGQAIEVGFRIVK